MDGLPYVDIPQSFGPIKTFGVLLAVGLLFALWLGHRYCRRNGLDEDTMQWLGVRLIAWGLVGSVVLNLVFYEWKNFLADPWNVTKALGISSYGAIVSATIAFLYYTRKRGLDRRQWADMGAWGVSAGWLLGRLGCAIAHDHVGVTTDSPFGVNFPPGKYPFDRSSTEIIRAHDLGLYEFLLWIPLIIMVILLERIKSRRPGLLLGVLALVYSVPRFLFEFLRFERTDPRYGGLTFAQWASIAAFAAGLWLLFGPRREPVSAPEPAEPSEPKAERKPQSAARKRKRR
jgi:phosphatidylglycerol---prolipoprotein diacylglyceryl transferase